jgi:predicted nucleic-acid-binding Zn-ribbon protein
MSVVQVIECLKCGNKETVRDPSKTPWEAWPKGCPKCGHRKVDVYVILDKQGQLSNANITIKKMIER